jgi:zinc transporter 1/2/3
MLFSVTAPIGIAIGISMSETYDETSYRANIIQGIFNGISCGLLLYVSLVQLISEDFIHHNLQFKTRFLSIISFCIGSLGMILIAVYGENEEHIEH